LIVKKKILTCIKVGSRDKVKWDKA